MVRARYLLELQPLFLTVLLLGVGFSGCLSSTPTDALSPTDAHPPIDADASIPAEVRWEGELSGACVPSTIGGCTYTTFVGGASWDKAVPTENNFTLATTALTWNATTPATEELTLGIYATRSCGNGCTEYDSVTHAMGSSPLEVTVAEQDVVGKDLVVKVDAETVTQWPLYGKVALDQPFQVKLVGSATGPLTDGS